jgi:hypothetical protein
MLGFGQLGELSKEVTIWKLGAGVDGAHFGHLRRAPNYVSIRNFGVSFGI